MFGNNLHGNSAVHRATSFDREWGPEFRRLLERAPASEGTPFFLSSKGNQETQPRPILRLLQFAESPAFPGTAERKRRENTKQETRGSQANKENSRI